jgi:hypothetical protein
VKKPACSFNTVFFTGFSGKTRFFKTGFLMEHVYVSWEVQISQGATVKYATTIKTAWHVQFGGFNGKVFRRIVIEIFLSYPVWSILSIFHKINPKFDEIF